MREERCNQDDPVPEGYESYRVVRSEASRNILMLRIENFGEEETKQLLQQAFAEAYGEIKSYDGPEGTHSNGWYSVTKDVGTFGKKYLLRAFVTWFAYGANLPEDSIYPVLYKDNHGDILESQNDYVIHFKKDGLPHSHAQDSFQFNEDGSLDLYISQNPPKENRLLPNWLPAAKEATPFSLLMRIYGADEQTLNGAWEFPTVTKVV